MAFYLVRAEPYDEKLAELRDKLDQDAFRDMQPFGRALTYSLEHAKWDDENQEAVWEEKDYCTPPLRMEREAVLDDYFTEIQVKQVEEGEGWDRIDDLPSLWEQV